MIDERTIWAFSGKILNCGRTDDNDQTNKRPDDEESHIEDVVFRSPLKHEEAESMNSDNH